MPTVYDYADAYLRPLITPELEARAVDEVAEILTVAEPWNGRLVVFRAYMLACIENQKSADDLFSVKFKIYRGEFDRALDYAKVAAEAAGVVTRPSFSIPIERA